MGKTSSSNGGGATGLLNSLMPAGTLIPSLATKEPDGWLLCDGRSVKQEDYKALYDVIKNYYGAGDEPGYTFNLPNFVDKTFWGAGGKRIDKQSNEEYTIAAKMIIDAGLPNITGWGYMGHSDTFGGAFYTDRGYSASGYHTTSFRPRFDASRSNPIYGNSDTVQPPAIAVNIFIKT